MFNDTKYRANTRITAYIDPKVKKRVIIEGRKANRTVSQEVAYALGQYYMVGK